MSPVCHVIVFMVDLQRLVSSWSLIGSTGVTDEDLIRYTCAGPAETFKCPPWNRESGRLQQQDGEKV